MYLVGLSLTAWPVPGPTSPGPPEAGGQDHLGRRSASEVCEGEGSMWLIDACFPNEETELEMVCPVLEKTGASTKAQASPPHYVLIPPVRKMQNNNPGEAHADSTAHSWAKSGYFF